MFNERFDLIFDLTCRRFDIFTRSRASSTFCFWH